MIERFTLGMDFDAYREDFKTMAAVERKLLLISEAAVRLGEQGPALCPGLPWENIRGIGNWLRHQYDRGRVEETRLAPRLVPGQNHPAGKRPRLHQVQVHPAIQRGE